MLNTATASNKDARSIFEESRQKLVLKNISLSINLTTSNNKGQSKIRMIDITYAEFDELKKVLFEFTGPENIKGTRILATDFPDKRGVIEIYMPSTGKVQKVRANQRNMRIMGSEIPIEQFRTFINAETTFLMLDNEIFNGTNCYRVKVTNNADNDYEIAYISIDNELLLHIDKFDSKDNLLSQTDLSDYQVLNNNSKNVYPQQIKVSNHKSGKTSVINVLQMNALTNMDIEKFNLESILTKAQNN